MKQEMIGTIRENNWQTGARKTFPAALTEAWAYLISPNGIKVWLGMDNFALRPGEKFDTGTVKGEIKIFKENSHIRLSWKQRDWLDYSIFHVRVFNVSHGAAVSFHHERLPSKEMELELHVHWNTVLEKMGERFRLSEN